MDKHLPSRLLGRLTPALSLVTPLIRILLTLALGTAMICYPSVVYQAARRGLTTWWEIVVPSLLPFFVIAELLMKLGFVRLLGIILEPAMRPLFNLPGSSGFIFTVSYISGSPLCAILTARLRQDKLCTREEGERLISFTSNASPLFILSAVSIGMYHNPALGPLIAGIHYFSSMLCGICWNFISNRRNSLLGQESHRNSLRLLLRRYLYLPGPRRLGFGHQLGETIRHSTLTLLSIGGFITIFSVLIAILQTTGILPAIGHALAPLADLLHLEPGLIRSLLYGFFEMTLGISETSRSTAPLWQQLMVIEAILAWNGLSVQAQVAGMMLGSDLGILPYLLTRLLQVPLAVFLTYLCSLLPWQIIPVATACSTVPAAIWPDLGWSLLLWLSVLVLLILLSLLKMLFNHRYPRTIIIR